MSELARVRELARAALASLEASRRRIDDLNVFPVADGDTGTNLALTARGVVEALDDSSPADAEALAREVTRAALLAARGNSGVILSQIVRGAADVLGTAGALDARAIAAAFRSASDAAYGAVREPVEGTMLTVVRELADAAEAAADGDPAPAELLDALVRSGELTLARTPELLPVLREAGVVDAGGAGLVEGLRGVAAALAGAPLPDAPEPEELRVAAVHRELSRFRYCTLFVVEGGGLDRAALERRLEPLGDSLLVVGDASALKVHVHTDDPDAALALGMAIGAVDRIEIADMHEQAREREARLAGAVETKTCEAVVVVAGAGNRRLFESLGAGRVIDGGRTMNPSTEQVLDAIEGSAAAEAIVLPNNPNVIMSAQQAARLATKPVRVVCADSIPAGLAAMVAYDGCRSAEANAAEMEAALAAVGTGAVTVASRAAEVGGVRVRAGAYLGLADGAAVAAGESFDDVARAVLEQVLAQPREVVTLITGEDEPRLDAVRGFLEDEHPELELEVQQGGQPHYPLLISAE